MIIQLNFYCLFTKYLPLFLPLIFVSDQLQAQDWKYVGTGSERSFYMIDSSSYLLASGGKIFKYSDGAKKKVYDSERSINNINDFTDNGNGTIYAVISIFGKPISRVVRSFDMGNSWEVKDVPQMPTPYTIYFYNENIGFIGCADAKIYRTTDGGENWKRVARYNYINFKSLAFVNKDLGFAVGGRASNSITLKTEDGGNSWSSWKSCGVDVNCAFFSSDSIGYFTSSTGVYKTNLTANSHWRLNAPSGVGYGPVYFINDSVGYLAVDSNKIGPPYFHNESDIYFTEDGGKSWVRQSVNGVLATITHFYRRGNRMYVNSGSISNETGELVLSTEINSKYLTSTSGLKRELNIELYPNPARRLLTLKGLLSFDYKIYTIDGKIVKSGNSNDGIINVIDLNTGLYILNISTEQKNGATLFTKY